MLKRVQHLCQLDWIPWQARNDSIWGIDCAMAIHNGRLTDIAATFDGERPEKRAGMALNRASLRPHSHSVVFFSEASRWPSSFVTFLQRKVRQTHQNTISATFQVVSSCDFDLPLQGALRNMIFSPMASLRFAIGYFELPFQGDFHKCLFSKIVNC